MAYYTEAVKLYYESIGWYNAQGNGEYNPTSEEN